MARGDERAAQATVGTVPPEPADPLGDAASDAFNDLASGRLDNLEQRTALYRHPRKVQLVMQLAGRDPSCTPRGEAATCWAILIGLGFTAAWTITAVIVAARYDLGFTTEPLTVIPVAIAIALIVVIFDWTIIRSHVQGGASRKSWFVRGLFTLCMVLLVSEVVASAVFDNDIRAQLDQDNAARATVLQQRVEANRSQEDAEARQRSNLQAAVNEKTQLVTELENNLEREEKGYSRIGGRGPRWEEYRLQLNKAEQELAAAQQALNDPVTGANALRNRVEGLQQEKSGLGATAGIVDYDALGPAQREALLWNYLIEHPSALFLKRIPLFVILVCLDLFALLLGLGVSRRTRDRHDSWATEQTDWEVAARFVRARVLEDAKGMIGRLVLDGMIGSAEQRAKRARQRRAFRATEHRVQDRLEHDSLIQQTNVASGTWPFGRSTGAGAHAEGPDIPPQQGSGPEESRTGHDEPTAPRSSRVNGHGSQNGATTFKINDQPDEEEREVEHPDDDTEMHTGPRRFEVKLDQDPGRQSDEDLAPFLDKWYLAGASAVMAERRLDATTSRESWRATLLTGRDGQGRRHVIKVFSISQGDVEQREEMSRDAINAQRMIAYSGGLDTPPDRSNWLAPGHFGTMQIDDHPDVPYLVMPYYPSGSVKEYVDQLDGPLTLDWCLRLSEQMFLACAQLADERIVGCDAKLANFVFDRSAYTSALTTEDVIAIGPVPQPDPDDKRHDPVVRMIDLSMVYVRGQNKDQPTRGARGTEHWSSPRAFSGTNDNQPFDLTSLDDAFTVAVNTMYLFTRENPRNYQFGNRLELEQLGGGDIHAEGPLVALGELLARLADKRVLGSGAETMLVQGREWLMERHLPESKACAAAAKVVRDVRETLNESPAMHRPFGRLHFVPADLASVPTGG